MNKLEQSKVNMIIDRINNKSQSLRIELFKHPKSILKSKAKGKKVLDTDDINELLLYGKTFSVTKL